MFKKSKLILIFAIIFLILVILFFSKYISTNRAEQIQTDSEQIQITTEDMQNTEVYSEDIDEYLYSNPINNYPLVAPTQNDVFPVSSQMPYMKIFVENKGNDPISVSVHYGTPSGPLVAGSSMTIQPHTNNTVRVPKPQLPGTYYVVSQGKNNYPMNGTLSVRVADSYANLDQ